MTDAVTNPIKAHCSNCGLSFSSSIGMLGNVRLTIAGGNKQTCPHCRHLADIEDGVYDAVGKVVEAVRSSPNGLEELLAFQKIAAAAQAGKLSYDAAQKRADDLSAGFSQLWTWINTNAGALALIVGIIGIFVALYGIKESDAGSAQAHQDAVAQRQSTDRQAQIMRSEVEELLKTEAIQEKIYEILVKKGQEFKANPIMPADAWLQGWLSSNRPWPFRLTHQPSQATPRERKRPGR